MRLISSKTSSLISTKNCDKSDIYVCHNVCHTTRFVIRFYLKNTYSHVQKNAERCTNGWFSIRLPTAKKRTGLSRSTIYLRMANNEFPHQISLGGRAVGWLEEEIDQWITERIEQRREFTRYSYHDSCFKESRTLPYDQSSILNC